MSHIDERIDARELEARARWEAYMRAEYDPTLIPKHTARPETRTVSAIEYAAYQLGQINRKLERFMELVEREAQK